MKMILLMLITCFSLQALALTTAEDLTSQCLEHRFEKDQMNCLRDLEIKLLVIRDECSKIVFDTKRLKGTDYRRLNVVSLEAARQQCKLDSKLPIAREKCLVEEVLNETKQICNQEE